MHKGSKGINHAKEDSNNSSPHILFRHTNHASMYTQQAGTPKSYKCTSVFNVSYSEGSLQLPSSRQHSLLTVQYRPSQLFSSKTPPVSITQEQW